MNTEKREAMDQRAAVPDDRPSIGISSCLLGQAVRHDGRDKYNPLILEEFSPGFVLLGCCPEVEIGLGTPRPPIRLVATADGLRARGVDDPARDVTEALDRHADRALDGFAGISGYIFKRGSPSCGIDGVPVFDTEGAAAGHGRGIFAAAVIGRYPGLPVEEEGRLEDPAVRENFIARVRVYHRWRGLLAEGLSHHGLIEFHSRHKFCLLAHDEAAYRRLGPLVAEAAARGLDAAAGEYIAAMMQALSRPAMTGGHVNVLLHVLGYFKREGDGRARSEMLAAIEDYRLGQAARETALALIRRHLGQYPDEYLRRQYYLYPEG